MAVQIRVDGNRHRARRRRGSADQRYFVNQINRLDDPASILDPESVDRRTDPERSEWNRDLLPRIGERRQIKSGLRISSRCCVYLQQLPALRAAVNPE